MASRAAARSLAAGFLLLGGALPAGAATLHVWKESPAPAKPYSSKLSAARRVGEALELAKPGDVVLVHGDCTNAAGRCTYQENLEVPCGVTLSGEGTPPATPILDGGGADRVLVGAGIECPRDQVTTIARLDIQNGKSDSWGGGIYLANRRALIAGNCIHDNQAKVGAGIYVSLRTDLPRPAVAIEGNLIETNVASERGGGVTVSAGYTNPSKLREFHLTFDGNTVRRNRVEARSGVRWGGGLDVYQARLRARHNLFEGNTIEGEDLESYGAHVCVLNHDENVPFNQALAITLKNAGDLDPEQFLSEDNIYRAGGKRTRGNIRGGGAIAAIWNASVRSLRDWTSDNVANTGGAIYVNVRSLLELDASHFEKNVAIGDGGVAYVVCDSRLRVNGDNLLESNVAHGKSDVGGERMESGPTPYPRGGGGLYVRNSSADLRGKNVLRRNTASGVAAGTAGMGGGLLLWQVDKALLFPGEGPFQDLEALICNGLTQLFVRGDNLFEDNTAEDEGGGIAILLEADRPGIVQRAGGAALAIERPFGRSQILAGTQLRGNRVQPAGAETHHGGGLYYHEWLLPGARQSAASKWARGQALVQGSLFAGNKAWGLKLVDTGLHLLSPDGSREWIQPVFELVDSVVQENAGGLTLWHSWPRVVRNHFLANAGEQLYAQEAEHLPLLTENHVDGEGVSRAGVSVIRAPEEGASPSWTNHLENNNLVGHVGHAAELELDSGGELHMERNYWGIKGPIVDTSGGSPPANSVGGNVLTAPPLAGAVMTPATPFGRISLTPRHPSPPTVPQCLGLQRDRPPGVPGESPGRPPDTPTPRQPDRSLPERPTGEPQTPPRGSAPTPERPRSAPDAPQTPEPPREPEGSEAPAEPSPPSEPAAPQPPTPAPSTSEPSAEPSPPQQPEWRFSLPAGRITPSTVGGRNFCARRHRFEVTLEKLPFLRLLAEPTFKVGPGEVKEIPVEVDTRDLAPGDYRGVLTIRCTTCGREPGCTQDRTLVPVHMTVVAAEG